MRCLLRNFELTFHGPARVNQRTVFDPRKGNALVWLRLLSTPWDVIEQEYFWVLCLHTDNLVLLSRAPIKEANFLFLIRGPILCPWHIARRLSPFFAVHFFIFAVFMNEGPSSHRGVWFPRGNLKKNYFNKPWSYMNTDNLVKCAQLIKILTINAQGKN